MKPFVRLILALSVARPLVVALVMLSVSILAVLGIFRISFEDGLRTMFTSDSPAYHAYTDYAGKFRQSETDIAVLVSSPRVLDGADFAMIEDFILEAQFIDGIGGVHSVFSLGKWHSDRQQMVPSFPSDLSDQEALTRAINKAAGSSITGLPLVSGDQKETVIAFSMGSEMSDMTGSTNTLGNLTALTQQMSSENGLQFHITGLIPIREGIIAGLKRDQMKINVLGAFLGFLISLAMFRSFWVALVNTITPITALILCLGAFGWLGLTINALTNALPVLILVLASSDSIHLTFEVRRRMGRGEDRISAVKNAITDIAAPCVLTSLTTMLAFSSLFYSSSPIVQDLALAGTAGVFIAMLVVLFVHPMVFILASRFRVIENALPLVENKPSSEGGPRLSLAIRKFRPVAITGVALCLAGIFVLMPIQPKYQFLENIDRQHAVVQTLKRVEAISGPINTINLPLRLNPGHEMTDPAVFADLAKIHAALQSMPGIRAVISLENLRRAVADDADQAKPGDVRELLRIMPDRLRSRLIGTDGATIQVIALVPDEGSQIVATLVDDMTKVVGSLKLNATQAGQPTGFLVMSSSLTDDMIGQLTISFLIAAFACPALIGLWFGRFDFGLAAIVPNILPIVVAGAGLTLLDFDIQVTSALALTIAFGIALDDSIHVFNRLHLQMQQDRKPLSHGLIASAIAQVRPVLIVTTVVLSAGLIATLTSEMPMIRFFGILCVVTFVLALICDLLLLPAIIVWLGRKRGDA